MSNLLCEDFYLISVNPEGGEQLHPCVEGGIVLAGLFDLDRSNYIDIIEEKIYLRKNEECHHSFLQKLINHLNLMPSGYNLQEYIQNIFYEKNELKKRMEEELLLKGVIEKDQKKFLSFIPYKKIKVVETNRINKIKEQIRHHVLIGDEDPYFDSLVLIISLCKIEHLFFSIGELKLAKEKINQILSNRQVLKSLPYNSLVPSQIFVYVDGGCDSGSLDGGCS